jgi:pilus assembly protein Flp/PilA
MTKLSSLKSKLSAFTADESGATLIEYGVIAALILVAAVTVLGDVGDQVVNRLEDVETALTPAVK